MIEDKNAWVYKGTTGHVHKHAHIAALKWKFEIEVTDGLLCSIFEDGTDCPTEFAKLLEKGLEWAVAERQKQK